MSLMSQLEAQQNPNGNAAEVLHKVLEGNEGDISVSDAFAQYAGKVFSGGEDAAVKTASEELHLLVRVLEVDKAGCCSNAARLFASLAYYRQCKMALVTTPNLLEHMMSLLWRSDRQIVKETLLGFMNISYNPEPGLLLCTRMQGAILDYFICAARTCQVKDTLKRISTIIVRLSMHDACVPHLRSRSADQAFLPLSVETGNPGDDALVWQSAVVLANMVGWNEGGEGGSSTNKVVKVAKPTLRRVVSLLKTKLDRPDQVIRGLWYSIEQLTKALCSVSVADSNKPTLLEEGAIDLLVRVINFPPEVYVDHDPFSEAQNQAARALWVLSFSEHAKQELQRKALEPLEMLVQNVPEAKTNAMGALFQLRADQTAKLAQSPSMPTGSMGHCMLSYNWGSQEMVLQLKESLTKRGFKCWIDVESMTSDILASMAGAIENSAVVLVCMTQKYQESPNCRTEASYCYQLKKPFIPLMMEGGFRPSSWLGALLGTKLYFNFADPNANFETLVDNVAKEMGLRGKASHCDVAGEVAAAERSTASSSSKPTTDRVGSAGREPSQQSGDEGIVTLRSLAQGQEELAKGQEEIRKMLGAMMKAGGHPDAQG